MYGVYGLNSIKAMNAWAQSPECKAIVERAKCGGKKKKGGKR